MTQEEALKILKTGANVFLTGEPGSGKTHTINSYVNYLRSHGVEPAITASTGIAATHIGGMTIHSWSGIGIKDKVTDYDIELIFEKERVVKRILESKVLIIDEISMLSSETMTSVEMVTRKIRRNEEAFGGLQVVLVGDFFQLPPIMKREFSEPTLSFGDEEATKSNFAFDANTWNSVRPIVCYLSEQYRQEDNVFLKTLSAIRSGEISALERKCLEERCFESLPSGNLTQLFTHNADVDRINNSELEKINGDSKTFVMDGRGAPHLIESLKKSCLSPELLTLKVGAKVMFTKNSFDGKFVNGTLGTIAGFSTTGYPIVKVQSGKLIEAAPMDWNISDGSRILATVMQIPLRLAWAITIHKSQGMSLDSAVIDLRSAFEYGQGYVALSRVRTLKGVHLLGFNERALEVHPQVLKKDEYFRDLSDEAREAFTAIPSSELKTLHKNFIVSSGGDPEGGVKPKKKIAKKVGETLDATKSLLLQKKNVDEISNTRGLSVGTVMDHIERLIEKKEITVKDIQYLKPEKKKYEAIEKAFKSLLKKTGEMKLSPVKELLGDKFDFDTLRTARLFISNK